MLIGQHRRGHQHGHLFRVAGRLEGGAYGHLGLAEAHIATHQTVHGLCLLHIVLHIVGGLQLVGGVFIEERCLQLVLQKRVSRESKASFPATGGIEAYQVAGNILELGLRTLLHALPLASA